MYVNVLVVYISRQQVLHRWQFGDVCQVPDGPGRWRRYFLARRRVEASIEQGRPTRDYRVSAPMHQLLLHSLSDPAR